MRNRCIWLLSVLMASLVFPLPSDAGERLQRWVFYMGNLWVDANVTTLQGVLTRAAEAGYTHALLSDSKFARLGGMDSHYFAIVAKIKRTAAALGIEIVPAVFPIGYSNDILFHDPNLIEALPVKNALLVVSNGFALAQADPPVAFRGGDFSDLSLWDWKDSLVVADNGAARMTDPRGANARKFKHQRTPRLPGLRSIVNVCLHERGEGLTW